MKSVAVKFVGAGVAAFNARDEHMELRLLVNDGKDKQFTKQLHIDEPTVQAAEILKEVRQKLKKAHSQGIDYGDDPLAGFVNIRWVQDEEMVQERLAKFLAAVREKIRNAKRKNMSYYDLERQIMPLTTSFD